MADSSQNTTVLNLADHGPLPDEQTSTAPTSDEDFRNSSMSNQSSSGETMGKIVKLAQKISRSENQCGKLLRHNSGLLQVLNGDHPMAARLQLDDSIHRDVLGQTLDRIQRQKALVRRKSGIDENVVREAALRNEFQTMKGLEQQIDESTSKLISATRPTSSRNQLNQARMARSLS